MGEGYASCASSARISVRLGAAEVCEFSGQDTKLDVEDKPAGAASAFRQAGQNLADALGVGA